MPGATTSTVEVTNISKHGLWLLTAEGEHFLAFAEFPWFRDAPVGHILNVEEPEFAEFGHGIPGGLNFQFSWGDFNSDVFAEC